MELHFEVSGSGQIPLVCIHGWGCVGSQFAALAGMLEKEFRVYRPDLPGHGRTPLETFQPGFESYAMALAGFLAVHRLEHAILVGHSMGGVLALMVAASGRIQPRAVVNLDGSLPAGERAIAGQRVIRGWLDDADFREKFAGAVREGFFLPAERDARCEEIVRTMSSAPASVLRFLPEQMGALHAEAHLPRVTAPVLYIGAAAPRYDAAKAAALLPHARFEQIHDAGHFLQIYAPDRVHSMTRDFLQTAGVI